MREALQQHSAEGLRRWADQIVPKPPPPSG
jgi:hypothetical protein